jgi:hypothetical protein
MYYNDVLQINTKNGNCFNNYIKTTNIYSLYPLNIGPG